MQKYRSEDFPRQSLRNCWPEEFKTRRRFNREQENEPYVKYVQDWIEDSEDEEAEDDDEDGNDPCEDESEVDKQTHACEKGVEGSSNNRKSEACNGYENVRLFMKGMEGDEETLQYPDQIEQVTGFCEQALKDDASGTSRDKKAMAIVIDDNGNGTVDAKQGSCKLYRGPLNSEELSEHLSNKRFRVTSDQSSVYHEDKGDSEKRMIFVADLDAPGIKALVTTASLSQAPTLRDLIYRYLRSRTSIGVDISSSGFLTYILHFNIPYYVLRENKEPIRDNRKKPDGTSLRESWEWPLLSQSTSTLNSTDQLKKCYLYEAQTSVAVTGFDDSVWTAYGFVDTYFGTESVDYYDQWKASTGDPDPLAAGQIDANLALWKPRSYYLKVLQIRINRVRREWIAIVDRVEKDAKYSRDYIFPTSSHDEKTRRGVRKFSMWNTDLVKLSKQLISRLSEPVEAWEEFRNQRKEIEYFLSDEGEPPAFRRSLKSSIAAIDKTFSDLRLLLGKLERFEKELCDGNPQGLHAHLGFENNDAAIFQQITSQHVKVLTVITIIFYPFVLATSMFSTQGVLPFTPNMVYFACFLLAFIVLVSAALAVLFYWEKRFQPIVNYLKEELSRKIIVHQAEPCGEIDSRCMSPSSRDSGQSSASRRFRTNPSTSQDLERGVEG